MFKRDYEIHLRQVFPSFDMPSPFQRIDSITDCLEVMKFDQKLHKYKKQ